MRALADEFEKRNDELGALVTMENGMVLSVCGAFNGIGSATRYRYFAGLAESWDPEEVRDYPEASSRPAKIKTIVRRQPAGVVGIVVPWNVPQGHVAVKLGAALAAGCTAVIKPSPETPLDSYFLAQAVTDAGIPRGVVNIVTGGDATGAALVAHHGIHMVAFTGSSAVGRTISPFRNDMRVAREEIFGPVLVVIRYDNEEEAIAIANDSEYGLGGTVFSRDVEHGLDIARRVETGSIGVNFAGMAPNAPFGGVKSSGIGRESGPEGFEGVPDDQVDRAPGLRSPQHRLHCSSDER